MLVALALIGGIVLLIAGGDDSNDDSGSTPTRATTNLQEKFLKRTVVNAEDGISVRRPGHWSDAKNNGVITLRSADRCVAVNLSAPPGAPGLRSLRRDALATLRQGFKKVRVGPGGRAKVGGIPTRSSTIVLTADKGKRRRVLLSIGKGERHTYLTEVVLGNPSCQADLALAQVVLGSIEYTK